MKLLKKVTLPIIFIFIVSLVLFSAIFYFVEVTTIEKTMVNTISKQIERITEIIKGNEADIEELKQSLMNDYLVKARTAAAIIALDPEMVYSFEKMDELAQIMDVEEVHVTDENGILQWGNVIGFYGFDFWSTEQTYPFLEILEDPTYELAQEATPRGADNELFQYIGVTRVDEPGIVQIGVNPMRLQTKLAEASIANVTDNISFNTVGRMLISDTVAEMVISSEDKSLIGKSTDEVFAQGLDEEKGSFDYTAANGVVNYAYYETVDDYKIIGVIEKAIMTEEVLKIFVVFTVLVFVVCIVCVLTLSKLTHIYVVKELKKLQGILNGVTQGDFGLRAEVSTIYEFNEMSQGINQMIESVVQLLGAGEATIQVLKRIGGQLGGITKQTNVSMGQIAEGVQNLTVKSEEQVEKAVNGESVLESIYGKIDAIRLDAAQSVEVAHRTQEITEQGAQAVEEQALTMDILINKFEKVADTVKELEKHTAAIDSIIDMSNKITDQIHLLSFNASIEAARVGEVGKGFAVVANEVKALADSSRQATEEIAASITQIKKDMEEATLHTKEAMEAIQVQKQEVDVTKEHFEKIVEAMKASLKKVKDISGSSKQIAVYTADIGKVMSGMKEATEVTTHISETISTTVEEQVATTQEIKAMTDELEEVIDKLVSITK